MGAITLTQDEVSIVDASQKAMQTNYQVNTLINMIASNIAVAKQGGTVTAADVLQVVKVASSMHLDPILGGVWAFKDRNNRLVCGISKKGWQQALHSQPDFCGIVFKNQGQLKEKKLKLNNQVYELTYYDACTCIIKKQRPDGTISLFEGTAYFDEEFAANKEPWLLRPKRMLEGRAMTICASNAYGWGAYDIEEVSSIQARDVVDVAASVESVPIIRAKGASKVKLALENKKKSRLISAMKAVKSREELTEFWKSLDDTFKEDEEMRTLASEIASAFNAEEIEKENESELDI